jgi:hypothetical protein
MYRSRYLEFYSCLGKFREPPVEGVFKNSDSGGANGSLPFFVCGNSDAHRKKQRKHISDFLEIAYRSKKRNELVDQLKIILFVKQLKQEKLRFA